MSLAHDPQQLRSAVERMFAHLARTHPDPEIAGMEQSIVVGKVHEYSSLEEAVADRPDDAETSKPRVVVISSAVRRANGAQVFYVRKGRENRDRSVQIGRTWGLETMTSLDTPAEQPRMLVLGFKKPYYWVFGSGEARQEFETVLRDVSRRLTGRELPSLLAPAIPAVSRQRTVSREARPGVAAAPHHPAPPAHQHAPPHQQQPHQQPPHQQPPHQQQPPQPHQQPPYQQQQQHSHKHPSQHQHAHQNQAPHAHQHQHHNQAPASVAAQNAPAHPYHHLQAAQPVPPSHSPAPQPAPHGPPPPSAQGHMLPVPPAQSHPGHRYSPAHAPTPQQHQRAQPTPQLKIKPTHGAPPALGSPLDPSAAGLISPAASDSRVPATHSGLRNGPFPAGPRSAGPRSAGPPHSADALSPSQNAFARTPKVPHPPAHTVAVSSPGGPAAAAALMSSSVASPARTASPRGGAEAVTPTPPPHAPAQAYAQAPPAQPAALPSQAAAAPPQSPSFEQIPSVAPLRSFNKRRSPAAPGAASHAGSHSTSHSGSGGSASPAPSAPSSAAGLPGEEGAPGPEIPHRAPTRSVRSRAELRTRLSQKSMSDREAAALAAAPGAPSSAGGAPSFTGQASGAGAASAAGGAPGFASSQMAGYAAAAGAAAPPTVDGLRLAADSSSRLGISPPGSPTLSRFSPSRRAGSPLSPGTSPGPSASRSALQHSASFGRGVERDALAGDAPDLQAAAPSASLERGKENRHSQHSLHRSPIRSPKSTAAYRHRRSLSETLNAASDRPEDRQMQDLASVIDDFKWTGSNVTSLERAIRDRLDQLAYQNFSGVVNLDTQLEEINVAVGKSIKECNSVDAKMQAVVMNLVGKGEDMAQIEGGGDGLQITALNYRKLASEIEKLLDFSRLDESFISRLYSVEFGNPEAANTPMKLQQVEEMLVDLSQALEMFSHRMDNGSQSDVTMQAFQEPRRVAQELAVHFAKSLRQFTEHQFRELLAKPAPVHGSVDETLECRLFSHLYIYSGCLLFVRDTCTSVHDTILHHYERDVRKVYESAFSSSFRNWTTSLEQLVGAERSTSSNNTNNNTTSSSSTGPAAGGAVTVLSGPGAAAPAAGASSLRDASGTPQLSKLSRATSERLYTLYSSMLDDLCSRVASQQFFLEKFFHLGSEGSDKFAAFVAREPLPKERLYAQQDILAELRNISGLNIDASKSASGTVLNIMQTQVFPQLAETAGRAITRSVEVTPTESVYLALILDIRSFEMRRTNQQYLATLLAKLQKQMSDVWEEISRKQTRLVLGAHFTTKKRVGVHPMVVMFTQFVSMVETSIAAALQAEVSRRHQSHLRDQDLLTYEGDVTRQMVDRSHGNMFRAIAQGLRMGAATSEIQSSTNAAARLKAAARETTGSGGGPGEETKQLLNRHVVMIENLYRIYTDLERFGSVGVQSIVLDAKQHYQRELEGYIADVISRPLGKMVAFVNQHEARSTHHVKPKESVSALKRVVKGYDTRELRAGVDQLRKRVEKHFTGSDPAVLNSVWRAIQAEFLKLYTRITRIAQNLDAMNYIGVSTADINSAFA